MTCYPGSQLKTMFQRSCMFFQKWSNDFTRKFFTKNLPSIKYSRTHKEEWSTGIRCTVISSKATCFCYFLLPIIISDSSKQIQFSIWRALYLFSLRPSWSLELLLLQHLQASWSQPKLSSVPMSAGEAVLIIFIFLLIFHPRPINQCWLPAPS